MNTRNYFFVLTLFACVTIRAATYYVADVATGDGSGSSPANRKSFSALDHGSLNPGDVVSIGGTNSGNPCPGCTGSGAAGKPITFIWETDALTTNAFDGRIYNGSASYITYDFGANAALVVTDNGTARGHQTNLYGLYFDGGAHDITIKNLRLRNYYAHTSLTDTAIDPSASGGIYANNIGSNFIISNGVISDVGWCINLQGVSGTNHIVSGMTFSNYDHGIALAGNAANSGFTTTNCDFGTTANWDTTANIYHHDGLHFYGGSGTYTGVVIAGNRFHGNWGNHNTAHIFMESGIDAGTCRVFNNIFLQATGNYLGDGFVAGGGHWFNNTFVGAGVTGSTAFNSGGPDLWFINNIVQGVGSFVALNSGGGIFSNNIYALPAPTGNNPFSLATTGVGSFNSWKSAVHDANSIYVNLRVARADGTLVSNSVAIGRGANLSALFTTDVAGAKRPASGAWDVGAYEVTTNNGVTLSNQIPLMDSAVTNFHIIH